MGIVLAHCQWLGGASVSWDEGRRNEKAVGTKEEMKKNGGANKLQCSLDNRFMVSK
jgi:hypothetical protein